MEGLDVVISGADFQIERLRQLLSERNFVSIQFVGGHGHPREYVTNVYIKAPRHGGMVPAYKLDATKAVCAERERELLELKGPCSTPTCPLHYAHSGPCDCT